MGFTLETLLRPLLSLLLLSQLSLALRFDLPAVSGHSSKNERCIRNFVLKDQLVVVTAIVDGNRGDGQMVNMHVCFHPLLRYFSAICLRLGIREGNEQWLINE